MKTYSTITFGLLFVSTIAFTSCNSNDGVKQADATNKQSPAMVPSGKVNNDDAQFATAAANGGMMEIELGTLCASQTKNTAVQSFGAMMVDDHTYANNDLKAIAANRNLVLPLVMSNKDQQIVDDMSKKTGSDFDKAYINMMVNDHEKVINEFRKESTEGKDADISSFATRTLPVLQKHLEAAKTTQKEI